MIFSLLVSSPPFCESFCRAGTCKCSTTQARKWMSLTLDLGRWGAVFLPGTAPATYVSDPVRNFTTSALGSSRQRFGKGHHTQTSPRCSQFPSNFLPRGRGKQTSRAGQTYPARLIGSPAGLF